MQKDAFHHQVLDQGCSMRLPHRHISIHSCLSRKQQKVTKCHWKFPKYLDPLTSLAKVGTSSSRRTKGARSISSRGPWHGKSEHRKKHNSRRCKSERGSPSQHSYPGHLVHALTSVFSCFLSDSGLAGPA